MSQGLISEKYLTTEYENATPEQVAQSQTSTGAPKMRRPRYPWPKGLTVICIFFVLISMLGMFSAISGFTNLYLTKPVESDLSHLGNDFRARKMKKQIREMESQAMATRQKYLPVYTYLEVMKFGISVAFAIAVGMLIIRNPKARRFAMITCGVAVFYHVSTIGIAAIASTEVLGPVAQFLETTTADPQFAPELSAEEREELSQSVGRTIGGIFLIAIGFYLLVKFVFYGVIMAYFCQQEIKQMFEGQPEEPSSDDMAAAPA